MEIKEMIETLRYKANNIKAKIEPEFFNEVADRLEMQVEKEVIDITPSFSDTVVYRCPKCKDIYTFKQGKLNYCSECGQKLDWSVVE